MQHEHAPRLGRNREGDRAQKEGQSKGDRPKEPTNAMSWRRAKLRAWRGRTELPTDDGHRRALNNAIAARFRGKP
jgi:hypothetical protein